MILMFRVADTHNVRTTGYRIQIHLILYYELASYCVLHTWRLTFRVADTHDVLTLGYSTWVYCMLHRRCTDTSHRMEMHHIPVACNCPAWSIDTMPWKYLMLGITTYVVLMS